MSVELDDQLVAIARELDVRSPPLTLADLEGRHADASLVEDHVEPKRHRWLLLAASAALVVSGVVAVLAVANNSGSSTQTPSGSLAPVNTAVVEESCPRPRQSVSFITSWLSVPDDTVFVSACAFDEAMRVVDNPLPIDVYTSASGNEVIAWLYVACGLEGGFVEVGAARPANCAELGGVHVEGTEPDDVSETVQSTAISDTSDPATSPVPSILVPGNSGYTLAPGDRAFISVGIHCGVRVFPSKLNGYAWETTEGDGVIDWVPNEWPVDPVRPDGPLTVEADLSTGGDTLTLTQNGRSVIYQQSGTEFRDDQLCA